MMLPLNVQIGQECAEAPTQLAVSTRETHTHTPCLLGGHTLKRFTKLGRLGGTVS